MCCATTRSPQFSDEDIANLDETLQLGGRIERDDWVGQAQRLMAETAAAEVPAEAARRKKEEEELTVEYQAGACWHLPERILR